MSHSLSEPTIKQWWIDIIRVRKMRLKQTPLPYLGYYRIFVQEIPNEFCYNYLSVLGVKCNNNGVILLDKSSADAYIEIQSLQ